MAKFIIEIRSKGFTNAKKRIDETTISLRKQKKQVDALTNATHKMRNATTGLTRAFGKFRNVLMLSTFAVVLFNNVMRRFREITPASELADLTRGFDNLRISAGLSSQTLEKLEEATNNTVDRMELMRQANNAMLLGVARSADELALMFDSAQRLARALGKDATFGIESFVTGLGRQSRLMLDNIGITIRVDQAYQKYADTLGITVTQMTDAQKKTAFLNEGLEQAARKADAAGKEILTTSDQLRTTDKAIKELRQSISQFLEPGTLLISKFFRDTAVAMREFIDEADEFGRVVKAQKSAANLRIELEKLLEESNKNADGTKQLSEAEQKEQDARKKRIAQIAAEIIGKRDLNRFEEELVLAKLGLREAISKEEEIMLKKLVTRNREIEAQEKIIDLEKQYKDIIEGRAEFEKFEAEHAEQRQKDSLQRNLDNINALIEQDRLMRQKLADERIAFEDEQNRVHMMAAKELAEMQAEVAEEGNDKQKLSLKEIEDQAYATAAALTSLASGFAAMSREGATAEEKARAMLQTLGQLVMIAAPGGAGALGGSVLQAMAGFIGHTGGLIQNNGIQRFATGGMVQGQDNVPIMAQAGEFIMQRSAVSNIGLQNLAQMNQTGQPSGGVTINIAGDMVGDEDHVRTKVLPAIKEELRREANA
jgi:hypothetical protein